MGVKGDEMASSRIVETPTRKCCNNGVSVSYVYAREGPGDLVSVRSAAQPVGTVYPGALELWADIVLRMLLFGLDHANQCLLIAFIKRVVCY